MDTNRDGSLAKPVAVPLKELTSKILNGYPFKSRVQSEPDGALRVVQLRNINDGGRLDLSDAPTVDLEDVKPQHLLKGGDVLFGSRGASMPAALVPSDIGSAVASAAVIIIRVKPQRVEPGYLVWFLNHRCGQRQLLARAAGSSLMRVSRIALSHVEIDLPPLEVQREIAKLAELQSQEVELMQRLENKRRVLLDTVLMKRAQGALK